MIQVPPSQSRRASGTRLALSPGSLAPRNGERQPLMSSSDAAIVAIENTGEVGESSHARRVATLANCPCDVGHWIVEQWHATVAFESLTPIPLHVAAIGAGPSISSSPTLLDTVVGIVACLVADKVSYIDYPMPRKGRRPATTMPPTEHFYTWHHVLLAVLTFDLLYAIAWTRHMWTLAVAFPSLRFFHICSIAQALAVLSSQVLFFLHVLDAFPMSWTVIAAPLAVHTLASLVQFEWQALLGLAAVAAALKGDGALVLDWFVVFTPLWVLLACLVSLVWLLPQPIASTDAPWRRWSQRFWLAQVGVVYAAFIPLAIKLEIGSTSLPQSDGSLRDWLPYRVMAAVWLLPVTCLAIVVGAMVVMVECTLPRA